ncbi:hypothetical protein MMC14_003515 [Varicellaria rhodocarpa]|nr:hypothetical protein [Varicellaria rhodocarpa]
MIKEHIDNTILHVRRLILSTASLTEGLQALQQCLESAKKIFRQGVWQIQKRDILDTMDNINSRVQTASNCTNQILTKKKSLLRMLDTSTASKSESVDSLKQTAMIEEALIRSAEVDDLLQETIMSRLAEKLFPKW